MSVINVYRQTATLPANDDNVEVTLDYNWGDTDYTVACEVPYQTSFWVTDKTNTTFKFHVGTTMGYDETIEFVIYHK